jgi:hypothetical protein
MALGSIPRLVALVPTALTFPPEQSKIEETQTSNVSTNIPEVNYNEAMRMQPESAQRES